MSLIRSSIVDQADEVAFPQVGIAASERVEHRLADPAQMGELFKVAAYVAPGWPEPAGFG